MKKINLNEVFEVEGRLYSIAIPTTAGSHTDLSGGRIIVELNELNDTGLLCKKCSVCLSEEISNSYPVNKCWECGHEWLNDNKDFCTCEDDSIPIKLMCSKCGKEWSSDAEPTRTTPG